jgi:hypothetical protein
VIVVIRRQLHHAKGHDPRAFVVPLSQSSETVG